MRTYIIRHTSVDVPPGMCYGQTDVPLRATFEQEAAAVRARIAPLSFERVYTSPLSRCTRLADFCGYPHAERDPRLLELHFGQWEWCMLYEDTAPYVKQWFANQLTLPTPGGESIMQLKARFQQFVAEKKREGLQQIALFAHGGILLSAMMMSGQTLGGDIFGHLPAYGSVMPFTF